MRIARIYDEPSGGTRILVDRLWPRGVSKAAANLDGWAKDLAPSNELRKAYHAGMSWDAFEARYRMELEDADPSALAALLGANVVLLTAARHSPNYADILMSVVLDRQAQT